MQFHVRIQLLLKRKNMAYIINMFYVLHSILMIFTVVTSEGGEYYADVFNIISEETTIYDYIFMFIHIVL